MPTQFIPDRSARWLVLVLYAIAVLAFICDLFRDNMIAYGIIYAPLVATAVFHKDRSGLLILTVLVCLLVIVGAFLPMAGSDLPDVVANRILSILAILATAAFVRHARDTQDRLAATTRRAEAAERIKTDVLTNVSREIRTPLHTLLGVLSLTMVSSKPDQREALGRVRADGKELLATIDNLLDLTQIESRKLQLQTVDIATIAQDAADSARTGASERQINIALNPQRSAGWGAAIGDSWAMRRILDNLLANAVRLTPPGGTVSVSVVRTDSTITASVSDTGKGPPPGLIHDFHDDHLTLSDTAVPATGMALSRRLAQAMNGHLTASSQSDAGATVSLSLPAA